MADRQALIQVFEQARRLLALPDNDYNWSSWEDANEAISEIDAILETLRNGAFPQWVRMQVIFAPTGPMQEVSLSSGWGSAFRAVADAFDQALEAGPCICLQDPRAKLEEVRDLGMDERYAEVWLYRCPLCEQLWIRYFHENEAFTKSGRWYHGAIDEETSLTLTPDNAKAALENLPNYHFGGSFYDGQVGTASGEIVL